MYDLEIAHFYNNNLLDLFGKHDRKARSSIYFWRAKVT